MKNRQISKIVAFIMAICLVIGALPVQSFAASIFAPKITKVEFVDENPISMKEVTRIFQLNGESDMVILNEFEFMNNPGTGFDYQNLKITLSDSRQSSLRDIFETFNDVTSYIHPVLKVSYNDCLTALKNGTPVDVHVRFSVTFRNLGEVKYDGYVQKEIVDEVLVRFENTSNEPLVLYEGVYEGDCIEGQEFEFEFADGTVKTAKIEPQKSNMWWDERLLDNRLIGFSLQTDSEFDEYDNEIINYSMFYRYMDEYYEQPAVKIPCPYEKIEITDYLMGENNTLKSISYTLTKKDGTKETYTKEPNCNISADYPVIDKLGPYEITVSVDIDKATFTDESQVFLWIYLGEFHLYHVVNTESNCSCLCHKSGVSYIIYQLISKIWDIFGLNEACKCGAWHW